MASSKDDKQPEVGFASFQKLGCTILKTATCPQPPLDEAASVGLDSAHKSMMPECIDGATEQSELLNISAHEVRRVFRSLRLEQRV